MKLIVKGFVLVFVMLTCSAYTWHKFHMSIYQINYVPAKKRLEITSRIFVDDMNQALQNRFNRKTHIGTPEESAEDIQFMSRYLSEHLKIAVNGNAKTLQFVRKEMENNIIVGYFKVTDIAAIKSIYIENVALMEIFSDQQNMMQVRFNGKNESLLFTKDDFNEMLK